MNQPTELEWSAYYQAKMNAKKNTRRPYHECDYFDPAFLDFLDSVWIWLGKLF